MAIVHGDNYWLARIARAQAVSSAPKAITFNGTDGAGKILTAATATVTADTVADGDTVTIDGRTYTFQTALVDVPDDILIGVSDATALDNLKSALNAGAGEGTLYGTGTTAHASVNATTNTDTTQVIAADTSGSAGNSIAVSATGGLSWGDTTLTGGADGTIDLFTATGNSLVAVIILCSVDLTGATATLEVGVSGATAKYIPQTTATTLDAGENMDITGIVAAGTALVITPNQSLFDGETIVLTPGTASITGGAIEVFVFSRELDGGASVDKV